MTEPSSRHSIGVPGAAIIYMFGMLLHSIYRKAFTPALLRKKCPTIIYRESSFTGMKYMESLKIPIRPGCGFIY